MLFDEKEFKTMVDEMNMEEAFKFRDIPNVDLYMDQVITLFEDKFKHFKRDENSKLLTKTMVNNYIKSKALMSAKNKKYTPHHMIVLILLFHLKQIISINDIKQLLSPIVENDELVDGSILEDILLYYNEIEKVEAKNLNEEIKKQYSFLEDLIENDNITNDPPTSKKAIDGTNEIEENNNEKELIIKILMVLDLTYRANIQKRIAEKIIDTF